MMRVLPSLLCLFLAACSESAPKPLGDVDASKPVTRLEAGAEPTDRCALAEEGCPCVAGEMGYCGLVYRHSEGRVDCYKGYATCQADGGFGKCEGATIFVPSD